VSSHDAGRVAGLSYNPVGHNHRKKSRDGADDAVGFELLLLFGAHAELGQDLFVVLPERRCRAAEPPVDRSIAERWPGRENRADQRVLDQFLESAGNVLWLLIDQPVVARGCRRDTGGDELVDRCVEIAIGRPLADVGVDLVVAGAPPAVRVEIAIGRPRRFAENLAQRLPLRIVLAREREPLFGSPTRVETLRRGPRAGVALAFHRRPVCAELDDLFGGGVERAFDHRRFDETTFAGAIALHEAEDRGERRVHPRKWITRALLDARLIPFVSGEPRQPGDLFHRLGEADVVAPGTVEPERRHAYEHRSRVDGAERVAGEAEALEDARREVLDHHVGGRHETAHDVETFGVAEVEREVALVAVRADVGRAPLPPFALRVHEEAGHADAVGALQ
jgi:hypothetical protein